MLRRFTSRSLRSQIALCIGLLGLLATLLTSTILGQVLAEHGRAEAGASLRDDARNAGQMLADGLFLRMREVQVLADSPTLWTDGLDSERVRQVLVRSQALNPHAAWIGVVDAAGRVVTATGGLLEGERVDERPWFQAGLQGVHVGDVHPAKLLAKLVPAAADGGPQRFVDFAAPIREHGHVVGVIGIHGSWDWAHDTIEKLLPHDPQRRRTELFIFDRAGRMIYAPLHGRANTGLDGQQPVPVRVVRADRPEPSAHATSVRWNDGETYLTIGLPVEARSSLADLGWTVVARQPSAVTEATARYAALLALAVGLVASGCAAWVGWLMSGVLTRELTAMAVDAQSLTRIGGLQALSARGGSREVTRLSQVMRRLIRRLQHSNVALERKVLLRTQELSRANEALERLATTDPLTGLLNRRGFDERWRQVVASAGRRGAALTVLALDADHFKRVNDAFGHDVGDDVLRRIAEVVRSRIRDVDVAARVGGEEFVVVLTDTGVAGARVVADDLIRAVRESSMPKVGRVTVSCGIAEMFVGCESAADALRRADEALYVAKRTGRDRSHVHGTESVGAHASAW